MTSIGCSWWLHLPPLFLDTHQAPPGPPPSQPQTPPVWLPALETPPHSAATVSASQITFPGLPAGASAHRTGLKVGHCWVYSALTQDDTDCVSPVCPPHHADPESCEDGPSASVLAFWMWGRFPPQESSSPGHPPVRAVSLQLLPARPGGVYSPRSWH